MIPSVLICLFLATASAAPALHELREVKGKPWTPEHILRPDEVILYGEDRMEIFDESTFHQLMESGGISWDVPEVEDSLPVNVSKPELPGIEARQNCDFTTSVVTDRTETFVDWDVQMSPVVIGTGNGIDVYVSSGYSVSNSVSVSAGLDWTVIKDKLGLSAGIDYTRTWTTQTVINIKGTVPDGFSGVMITKPIKTRKYGRAFRGCVGSLTETGTFMGDSFEEGSYAGVKWVSGAITMCAKKEFPLSRCNGQGNFI